MKKIINFSRLLLIALVLTAFSTVKSQEYVQTTFSATGNQITVSIKSSATITGIFSEFSASFRFLDSYGIDDTLIVTNSNYSTVELVQQEIDPNDPLYRNYKFGYVGGTSNVTFNADQEYPVFTFKVTGGVGVGTIGLIQDNTNFYWYPDCIFNNFTNYYTNYTTPFYGSLDNSDFVLAGESWFYRTLDVNLGKYWKTDAATTSWGTAANWSDGVVPVGTDDLTIFSGSNQPVVGAASLCNKLYIDTSASVEVATDGTLTINGDLTIEDDTSLLIKSSNTGTGSLITNGSVPSGNKVKLERHISNDNSWHFLSSPVAAQAITPEFAPTVMDTTFDFYKWDEAANNVTGTPWVNLRATPTTYEPTFETAFAVGRGYLVAYNSTYTGDSIHSFLGVLGTGDKSITVAYTNNHYNLIGNPYPSAIDWDDVDWGTNRDATLGATPTTWIWNQAAGNYGVYVNGDAGVGTNDVTNIIAPNQGFFVEAIAAGSFTMPNASRVHPGSQAFLKSTPAEFIKLKVNSTANAYSDEMIVKFDDNTTNEGVAKWFSFVTEAPSLYAVKNNKNYTINTFTEATKNLVVPVNFIAGANGNYTITADGITNFSLCSVITLEDTKNQTVQDLMSNQVYNFTATTTDNVNRFKLHFGIALGIDDTQTAASNTIYSYDNSIYINTTEKVKSINVYNLLGQEIINTQAANGNLTILNAPNGYFIVKVVTDKNVYSEKVLIK